MSSSSSLSSSAVSPVTDGPSPTLMCTVGLDVLASTGPGLNSLGFSSPLKRLQATLNIIQMSEVQGCTQSTPSLPPSLAPVNKQINGVPDFTKGPCSLNGQSLEAMKAHSTFEEAVEALSEIEGFSSPLKRLQATLNIIQPSEVQGRKKLRECRFWRTTGCLRKETCPYVHIAQHKGIDNVKTTPQCIIQLSEVQGYTQSTPSPAQTRPNSITPLPCNGVTLELFPVWVGSLVSGITETRLRSLFSVAGEVYSVKMLMEQQCAFVHYTRKEDCETAIQRLHGLVVEGTCLAVRHPCKIHPLIGVSLSAATYNPPASVRKKLRECRFWRTTGCFRKETCPYVHIAQHKGIDNVKTTPQ